MEITIKFTPPLSDKEASFRHLAETGIYESLARVGNDAAVVMMGALVAAAPRRTGAFANGIRMRQQASSGGGLTYNFTAGDPLATWIIEGTKPHKIEPHRVGGVLRFVAASGDVVFTRHVDHPGTKPNDFPQKAWAEASGGVIAIFQRMGREIAAQVH